MKRMRINHRHNKRKKNTHTHHNTSNSGHNLCFLSWIDIIFKFIYDYIYIYTFMKANCFEMLFELSRIHIYSRIKRKEKECATLGQALLGIGIRHWNSNTQHLMTFCVKYPITNFHSVKLSPSAATWNENNVVYHNRCTF